ncbi:MAG: HNH endonuclease signature motif containing protein [Pseudohongiella sp.]|uniref:HNH endonuclease n=1 Tax=Pseudohongiella sp. TaxID=1979412 RepID=UPI0034A05807
MAPIGLPFLVPDPKKTEATVKPYNNYMQYAPSAPDTAFGRAADENALYFKGDIVVSVNQVERAYRAWPILIKRAENRSTITYGELGQALGVYHRAVRYVLGVLQDYCLEERLPPLTILIVNASGRPGTGFIAFDLENFEEGLDKVYDFDWRSLDNPFSFAESGDSYESIVTSLTHDPSSAPDIYTRVKSRGIKQIIFRNALLKAYSSRCAFTNIAVLETLEACHIVPWSQASPAERLDVRNGLLLNSFHHKLFDRGYITLTTDHRIIYYDPNGEERSYSDIERSLTIELHGKCMLVPHRAALRPDADCITKHHEIAGWEGNSLKYNQAIKSASFGRRTLVPRAVFGRR